MHANLVRTAFIGLLAAMPTAGLAMNNAPSGGTPSMSAPDFDAAAEYRKGMDALKANQFSVAKSSFARVLGVAPDDANTHFLAGMADAGLNDFKSAAKHYAKAVRQDGKLIVAGRAAEPGQAGCLFMRLNVGGALDANYGGGDGWAIHQPGFLCRVTDARFAPGGNTVLATGFDTQVAPVPGLNRGDSTPYDFLALRVQPQ